MLPALDDATGGGGEIANRMAVLHVNNNCRGFTLYRRLAQRLLLENGWN